MSWMALYVVIIRGFMYDLMIVLVQLSFLFWGIEIILRHNFDLFNHDMHHPLLKQCWNFSFNDTDNLRNSKDIVLHAHGLSL